MRSRTTGEPISRKRLKCLLMPLRRLKVASYGGNSFTSNSSNNSSSIKQTWKESWPCWMKMTPKYRRGRLKQPKASRTLLVPLHTPTTHVLRSKASSILCSMVMCLMLLKLLPVKTVFYGMACGTWMMSMAISPLQLVQLAKLVLSTTLWFPSLDFEQQARFHFFFYCSVISKCNQNHPRLPELSKSCGLMHVVEFGL